MAYKENSFSIDGLESYYMEGGSGYPLLLVHGSGPGASTPGNWSRVLQPLAGRFHVHALDLIGFGRSARKTAEPYFDPELWLRQCEALLEQIPGTRVGVLAHSLSAVLALRLAGRHAKVAQVLTTGALGAPFRVNEALSRAWTFPQDRDALRTATQALVFDQTLIDDTYLDVRMKVLHADRSYGPYFSAMFAGDKQQYIDRCVLTNSELAGVRCPVTLLHGRDDRVVPPEVTLDVARQLPQADVILLAHCSHSVALEQPEKLLAAAFSLFE